MAKVQAPQASSFVALPKGHDEVRGWLARVGESGRASGGYLFLGPQGIGKRAMALWFAATLRCREPADNWACGECGECTRVLRGLHPNVRAFSKPSDKSFFPVDLVREICDEASRTRFEAGLRVFLVDDADRFNENSANAFLKTLEEPPEGLIFVLLAGNSAQVLPTILSRCQMVRFSPLAGETMLEIVSGWDDFPQPGTSRNLLLRAAQGSPGALRRLLDLRAAEVSEAFAQTAHRDPFAAAESLHEAISRTSGSGAEGEEKRDHLRVLLGALSVLLHRRLLEATSRADPCAEDLVSAALLRLDDLRERVDGNANPRLLCDVLAFLWPE